MRLPLLNGILLCWNALAPLSCGTAEPTIREEAFPNRREAIDTQGRTVGYVANELSDSVSVLDLDEGVEIARVPVGVDPVEIDGPHSVVVDSARGRLYTLLGYPLRAESSHDADALAPEGGVLQMLDLESLAPLAEFTVDASPAALALSGDQRELAVVHDDKERALLFSDAEQRRADVLFFDLDSLGMREEAVVRRSPVCVVPVAATYSAAMAHLYVACSGDDTVTVLDPAHGTVLESLSAGDTRAEQPSALGLDSAGTRLVLSNRVSREAVVFALGATSQVVSRTKLPGVPGQATWTATDEVLVPLRDPDAVVVVGAIDGRILRQKAFADAECPLPHSGRTLVDGRVFVVCSGDGYEDGKLVELDVASLEVVSSIPLGRLPDFLEVRLP